MGVDSVNWGNVTTASTYVDATSELMPGEKLSSNAISINDSSVAVEGTGRGSGTGIPTKLGLESNVKISHFHQEVKGEVVETAVKVDAEASELLDKRMAEEGQPKV